MKFPAFEPIDLKNNTATLEVNELRLSEIAPDKNQPRKKFHEESLKELASSIKQYGIVQPVVVNKIGDNQYQIIAGERRWRAAKIAGINVIPAIIQNNNKQKNIAVSLIENIQREELNSIELAEAFYRLNIEHGLSHEAIAAVVGKSRATVTNLLRLLNLSKNVRDLLIDGKLEMGHARSLLALPYEQQTKIAQRIVKNNLTVRDAERLVRLYKLPKEKKNNRYACEVNSWVTKLKNRLSSKVAVNINEKGEGRVVIYFSSPNEVDWLIEQLGED